MTRLIELFKDSKIMGIEALLLIMAAALLAKSGIDADGIGDFVALALAAVSGVDGIATAVAALGKKGDGESVTDGGDTESA